MKSLAPHLDLGTRKFWRLAGREVDLRGRDHWLNGPRNVGSVVEDSWLGAAAESYGGGRVREPAPDAGLLADLAELDGPSFSAADVHPAIRDFYQRTSAWRMEVWTQWNPLFQPGGDLVTRLFGRRVRQLALPMRPLDVALGMDSQVAVIEGEEGRQRAAGWLRTLRATGEYVFSGCYSPGLLPASGQPSVHVVFPLESGNVQVFLQPSNRPGGGLGLHSGPGRFGENGSYVLVEDGGRTYAARVPLHETFTLYVDDEDAVRTDHALHLRSMTALRLHYKLNPGTTA